MKHNNEDVLIGCASVILIIGIGLFIHIFSSYMESKTYNKLTGAKTTTWDAMWVELRVQDNTNELP